MGFWQGVAKATGEIAQEKFAREEQEKERKYSEEQKNIDRRIQQEQFDKTFALQQARLVETLGGSRSSSAKSADELSSFLSRLKALGVNEENINLISTSGSASSAKAIADMVEERYEAAYEMSPELGAEFRTNINTVLSEGLVFNPSEDVEVEIEGLDEVLTITQEGSASVFIPPLAEPESAAEVTAVEKRIVSEQTRKAQQDFTKIDTALTTLYDRLETIPPGSPERSLVQTTIDILTNRKEILGEALESTDGDVVNYEPILQIYGNKPSTRIAKNYGINLNLLDPIFQEDIQGVDLFDLSGFDEEQAAALREIFVRLNLVQ